MISARPSSASVRVGPDHSNYKSTATMAFLKTIGTVTDINILNPEHEEFDESKCLDRFKTFGVEYVVRARCRLAKRHERRSLQSGDTGKSCFG
jgi:hypothetical protein